MKDLLLIFSLMTCEAQAGNVLMIDLNDSTQEMNYCNQGIADNNRNTGSNDQLVVFGQGTRVNAQRIQKYFDDFYKDPNNKDVTFDSIIISGHDGNGEFFGDNPRDHFLATDLRNLVNSHPQLKNFVAGLALWGCYGATANAAENFWEFNISDNIKTVASFPIQSPRNTVPDDWRLLKEYCSKRHQIDAVQTKKQIEDVFHGIKGASEWHIGLCDRDGICARDYNKVGDPPQSCFHSYAELHERCKDFDPGNKQLQMFENYMSARDPADPKNTYYDDPPPDGEDEFVSEGKDPKTFKRGEVRSFYNQLHLWRQCATQLGADKSRGMAGYQMPLPAQVIRLTKFESLKTNFARIEKGPLADYDSRLRQMGLGEYALDDLPHMSRRKIVDRIEKAEAVLNQMAGKGHGPQTLFDLLTQPKNNTSIDPLKMLTMAEGFDRSLRQLDLVCTDFTYVEENAVKPSPCVAPYGEEPKWQGH